MRLANNRGDVSLMASATSPGNRQAEEEAVMTDAVPEPPGKHRGGVQPLAQVAGADR
jgi:hypothetical protein